MQFLIYRLNHCNPMLIHRLFQRDCHRKLSAKANFFISRSYCVLHLHI